MLRSVGVARGRSVRGEIGGSSAEPGRVGISARKERIAALEESVRQTESRWLAAPTYRVLSAHDRTWMDNADRSRCRSSVGLKALTPADIHSSGYGSHRRNLFPVPYPKPWGVLESNKSNVTANSEVKRIKRKIYPLLDMSIDPRGARQ